MLDLETFKAAFEHSLSQFNLNGAFDDNEYDHMYRAFVADIEAGVSLEQALMCALYYNTDMGNKEVH